MEQIKTCNPKVILPESIIGPSTKIGLKTSSIHGHGIFSNTEIAKGELIEEAKMLKLSYRSKIIQDSVLVNYAWLNTACNCDLCQKDGQEQYIALGFGSIYNHSKNPNTVIKIDFATETMKIYANRIIEKDEEILVNYGPKYWLIREFWKKVSGE
ncbi:SET domain-containing protein-lysine N-methyltransferase [Aquirufa sp. ROCK2-A2]